MNSNMQTNAATDKNSALQQTTGTGEYASVGRLKMYYEIHGTGRPLVLLHGSFMWATNYPMLAEGRRTIAVDLQGHGRTADIDRPFTFEQMADDTAALLKGLKIEQADVFGYSMGGTIGLALAIRHSAHGSHRSDAKPESGASSNQGVYKRRGEKMKYKQYGEFYQYEFVCV